MDPELDIADVKEEDDVDMIPFQEVQALKPSSRREHTSSETVNFSGTDVADSQKTLATDEDGPANQMDTPPPLADQIKTIETLVKAFSETPVQDGDVAYLVSRQWLKRALAFGSGTKSASQEGLEGPLGAVDNTDLIYSIFTDTAGQDFVRLKPGMGLEHFELFPKPAWDMLMAWYGLAHGQKAISRMAHDTSLDPLGLPNVQYEFYPPVFTIHRLWSRLSPLPIEQELKLKNPPPVTIVHSTSYKFHDFMKQVKTHAHVPMERKVRLWTVIQTLPTTETSAKPQGISTPPDSPGRDTDSTGTSWPHLLLELPQFAALETGVGRNVVADAHDTTHHEKYNGSKTLAMVNLTVDQTLVIDENIDNTKDWVSNYVARNAGKDALKNSSSRGTSANQLRGTASGRNSPAPQGPMTRGRTQQKSGKTIGCVGLQNLGNTCYMNSALQCVRSVEELTKYFLTHEAEKEVNPDNPLSHNGDVARAYGRLLEEIYKDPAPSAVAPRQFKNTIGRYAPSFSGYGQQDSQEFLGFLLDGLQEDLNRIKKKPYIEKPDSTDDMIGNPTAIREMAEKVWDITKKRDDSVIADLFTGMYQSTLVCPVCAKVSITFDPFTNLTLPLPIANIWTHEVKYYPLNDTPVKIIVDIDKSSSIKTMKEFISTRVGVPFERLAAAEEFRDKFFKMYEDLSSVSEEIQQNDIPAVYELEAVPTNVSNLRIPKKKPQKYRSLLTADDGDDKSEPGDAQVVDRLLVPVLHRVRPDHAGLRRRSNKSDPDVTPPHFIVLTPEEARDQDIITRKILEKLATFSTWSAFRADESETSDNTDPDMVITTSDADSAGDSNVVAKSIEGEDGLVDVTMTDARNSQKPPALTSSDKSSLLLKKFNHKRPKWINRHAFLNADLQNLFELCYFSEAGRHTPSGWQSVQSDNHLPKISSRVTKPAVVADVEMRSPGTWAGSEDSGSEQSNPVTRMVDESSEEDSDFPRVQNIAARTGNRFSNQVSNRGRKKLFKPHKTYGKKGKKRLAKQQDPHQRDPVALPDYGVDGAHSSASSEDDLLIRLGEGIVVDWNEEALDDLYGGDLPPNETKGTATFYDLPVLHDPALEIKKKQRQMRRKNGITLDDCLAEFEKEEILSEQDTWYCPRCKEHRRASKKFDLWKTPDILAVHLKRFSSSGWRREKLDVMVDFPVDGLDLTERVIDKEDGKQEIYDLIAVDDHWGGLGGGHYTAFAKNFVDGEWYEYNDTSVQRQKDTARVVTSAAYLLFYRRRSDVPLGGSRFREIFDRYNSQTPEDENSDSGEGQRLGHGSSLPGSSSALKGAGLTLHSAADRGSGRSPAADGLGRSISSGGLQSDKPPAYGSYVTSLDQLAEADDGDSVDGASLNGLPGTGMIQWNISGPDAPLRRSIEAEDEAIDLQDFPHPTRSDPQANIDAVASAMSTNWNFTSLKNLGARSEEDGGSDVDIASDEAQNSSSGEDATFSMRLADDEDDDDDLTMQHGRPTAEYVVAEAPAARKEGYADTRPPVYHVPADVSHEQDDLASERVDEIVLADEEVDADAGERGKH